MATPDASGRFGQFGGRFVPEALMPACLELEQAFDEAWASPAFRAEFEELLRTYANRPSPLMEARNLSERLGVRVLLKREEMNHTGSHKINNVLGQALLTRHMRAGPGSSEARTSSTSSSQRCTSRRCATSRHALTTSRWSHVPNADSPRNWPSFVQSFAYSSGRSGRRSWPIGRGRRSEGCMAGQSTRRVRRARRRPRLSTGEGRAG
jgi:hypothetical protein